MTESTMDEAEPAAFQGGNRVASITPEGQAMNRSLGERTRVTMVPKSPGEDGQKWSADASAKPDDDHAGGFGMVPPEFYPAERPHEGGDPLLDGDAQYGASPIRPARYAENHQANQDIRDGKLQSDNHGAQARYPRPEDVHVTSSGHDEQQASRDLAQSGR